MRSPDLLRFPFDALRDTFRASLINGGLTPGLAGALVDFTDVIGLALVALLMVPIATRLYARRGPTWKDPWLLTAAAVAGVLLTWIVRHPSRNIIDFFVRWDHLAFCALAGGLLTTATPTVRLWTLALMNGIVMWQYFGPVATPLLLAAIAVTYLALGLRGAGSALVLSAVACAVYATCWYLRSESFGHSVVAFGLFSLVFLRQVSAAIALAGAQRPQFGGYFCYLTFYLGGFGLVSGPEVYTDFARRNFGPRLHYDPIGAAREVAWGALQIWLAFRVPATIAELQQATSTAVVWQLSLLLFVRSALYGMGLWAVVNGSAVFYGIRLQPSFRGILTRQNPTELWWAWRGAFTNWLVRHIYAPITARGLPKGLAIFTAFSVSWAWHVLGLPFLTNRLSLLSLVPITLWALVNVSAIVGQQYARDNDLHLLPSATPPLLRRVIHTFLTACVGTFSVTFLSYQGDPSAGFFGFLRRLIGL